MVGKGAAGLGWTHRHHILCLAAPQYEGYHCWTGTKTGKDSVVWGRGAGVRFFSPALEEETGDSVHTHLSCEHSSSSRKSPILSPCCSK